MDLTLNNLERLICHKNQTNKNCPFLFFYFPLQVPELAGSWLLTLLVQFPLIMLLLFNEAQDIYPLERAINLIMALFVWFEVICGYFAIRTMVNYQMTRFHLRQFTDLEQINTHSSLDQTLAGYT